MIRLETPRLILRDMLPEDADAFSSYNQSPEFCRYRDLSPSPKAMREKVLRHIEQQVNNPKRCDYIMSLVHDKDTVIGDIRLQLKTDADKHPMGIATIGYGLNPTYWNRGLAGEAVTAVTRFGHHILKLHRVEAEAHPENIGSWKVLEKCGYIREAVRHYRYRVQGMWWPETYEYASVREDLVKQSASLAE